MSAAREKRGGGGLSIAGRFSLFMTLALLVVMSAAGFFLLQKSRAAVSQATRGVLNRTAQLTVNEHEERNPELFETLREFVARHGDAPGQIPEEDLVDLLQQVRSPGEKTYTNLESGVEVETPAGRLVHQNVEFDEDSAMPGAAGLLVRLKRTRTNAPAEYHGSLLAPADPQGGQGDSLFGLILVFSAAVIAVGAGVALVVSAQVTKPLEILAADVRSISHGNLHHRTKVKGGGEVYHLARQIDRMAQTLEEAQENEIELSVREREREVAHEVRDALLPQGAPTLAGFALADVHEDAADPGGDFHDFVTSGDRLSLLVCEVSGRGVPGALVGATARAYLRGELERDGELGDVLKKVNRQIAHDVRRGMYVTALCVQLSPNHDIATVACAGHKMPLVRYSAESKSIKIFQPEGIALGFDKGPVFERSLEVVQIPLGPGDRLVLATTGPAQVQDADGNEVGDKGFYRLVARAAGHPPDKMVAGILGALHKHADGEAFPADVSLVVVARES